MEKRGLYSWRFLLVLAVLVLSFLFGSYLIVKRHTAMVEAELTLQVKARAANAREYMLVAQHLLLGLSKLMEETLALSEAGALDLLVLPQIHDYPGLNTFVIDPETFLNTRIDGLPRLVGSLSGAGQKGNLGDARATEVNAALALNPLFESVLQSLPDLQWVYYTSKQHFVFMAPARTMEQGYFSADTYQQAYWQQAAPEQNPQGAMVVTEVYMDGAGKGPLISMVMPVFFQHEFRGVLALDIGLARLTDMLKTPQMIGYSALLDEHAHVIFKDSHLSDTRVRQDRDSLMFSEWVLHNQVRLLHKVPREAIVRLALVNSWLRISQLALGLLLVLFAYYQWTLMRKVRQLADTDPLTGLMNRRAMERVVETMIAYSNRYRQQICFLLIDLDYFKRINDNYGHAVGDKVLLSLTELLQSAMRESDQLSRHGGEEFLAALPNTDQEEAFQLAERLRRMIADTPVMGDSIKLTISIGCAELLPGESYSNILKRADDALYRAKDGGRNQTQTAD